MTAGSTVTAVLTVAVWPVPALIASREAVRRVRRERRRSADWHVGRIEVHEVAGAGSFEHGVERGAPIDRLEQVLVQVQSQPRLEDLLRLRPNEDDLVMPTPRGLVPPVRSLIAAGPVLPDLARHVQVDAPHDGRLTRSHTRVALQLDHRLDWRSEVRESCRYQPVFHGADCFGFDRPGPTGPTIPMR